MYLLWHYQPNDSVSYTWLLPHRLCASCVLSLIRVKHLFFQKDSLFSVFEKTQTNTYIDSISQILKDSSNYLEEKIFYQLHNKVIDIDKYN